MKVKSSWQQTHYLLHQKESRLLLSQKPSTYLIYAQLSLVLELVDLQISGR